MSSPLSASRHDWPDHWRWSNSFAQLGPHFFTRLAPQPLPEPSLVAASDQAAALLGLDPAWLNSAPALALGSGNAWPEGADPLASVYSGHQFGGWAGQLGDGRALLLGELQTPVGQQELQLKGSGRTPYSRRGDGRAVLRSSIREFLASEAMAALGVPSTRALSVVTSPLPVQRETLEQAAVVIRLAPSFIRLGHFEHFSAQGQHEQLQILADFVIERFYPACQRPGQTAPQRYAALLQQVSQRTAALLAHWQAIGFCHGVMNSDNMSILGLTLDYGPFQFLDGFDPGHICNHSDSQGRYAFERQPQVAYWNLLCLAQALLPLIEDPALAEQALADFPEDFGNAFEARMRAKLGLSHPQPGDRGLIVATLALLGRERTDYPLFWRRLSQQVAGAPLQDLHELFAEQQPLDDWLLLFSERLTLEDRAVAADLMLKTNPHYVLRTHLAQQAIEQAQQQDYSGVRTLLQLLQTPWREQPGHEAYAQAAPAWAAELELSCSS